MTDKGFFTTAIVAAIAASVTAAAAVHMQRGTERAAIMRDVRCLLATRDLAEYKRSGITTPIGDGIDVTRFRVWSCMGQPENVDWTRL